MRSVAPCLLFCLLLVFATGPAAAQYGGNAAPSGGAGPAQDDPDQAGPKQDGPKKGGGGKSKKRGWGQSDEDGGGWKHQYEMRPRTAKRIVTAREHLLAERYAQCVKELGRLRMKRLNPLERAQVFRILAFVDYGQGDLDGARDYLQKTIDEDALSPDDVADIRYQIAQLYLQEERWPEAAASFEAWFEIAKNPNPSAYHTLALTYYQMQELEKALIPAQTCVAMTDEPREGWIQLLLALRLTRKEYELSIPLLEELVGRYPKKTYWMQLSTVHGALGHYQDSLVQLQLAYRQDLLTEDSELRRMAELMLFMELPHPAAEVLQRGLDEERITRDTEAYELLSNSRIASRDFDLAVEPLEIAARLSETGELYIRLAQVHLQVEDWQAASESLERALEKGGLENEGDAQLLMGITFYSQKQPRQALTWFGRATRHEETVEEATTWLQYIARELQAG